MATTAATARPSKPKKAARQIGPAHPSTVTNACAISLSWRGADEAIAADRPTALAAETRKIESIVRLLRRPGSVSVSRSKSQERPPTFWFGPSALTRVKSP